MSYIISNNEIIAYTDERLKSGQQVRFAYYKTFDAVRQCDALVNASNAKISNAKKWDKECKHIGVNPAQRLYKNDVDFLVSDLYPDFFLSEEAEGYC